MEFDGEKQGVGDGETECERGLKGERGLME